MNILNILKLHATNNFANGELNVLLSKADKIPYVNERLAWALGAEIEFQPSRGDTWMVTNYPSFSSINKYRIKPPVNPDQERFDKLSDEHKRIAMAARELLGHNYLSMDSDGEAYFSDQLPALLADGFDSFGGQIQIKKLDNYYSLSEWKESQINLSNVTWESVGDDVCSTCEGAGKVEPLDCIQCDNSGAVVLSTDDQGYIDEIGPCEWCHRVAVSKFNLLANVPHNEL